MYRGLFFCLIKRFRGGEKREGEGRGEVLRVCRLFAPRATVVPADKMICVVGRECQVRHSGGPHTLGRF